MGKFYICREGGLLPRGLNNFCKKQAKVGAEKQEGPEFFLGGAKGQQCGWRKGLGIYFEVVFV